jgi:hypothetical protein
MAVPTFVGAPVASASISAISPILPTGLATDDILLGIGETAAQDFPAATPFPPTGWAHVTLSPVTQDSNTKLTLIWTRVVGGETAQNWGDSGDHNIGRIIAYRGCKTTGNPWNVLQPDFDATSDTSAQWPSVTTTVDDCLILFIGAWSDDFSTGALSGGTGLGAFTERIDSISNVGNDGAIFLAEASKVTAGATGTPIATLAGVAFKAMMTLALEPAPPGVAAELPILVMPPLG